jgi:hypothetical protein
VLYRKKASSRAYKKIGIPVVITDVLVRKQKSMGRNIYINHPDSILKIERKNTVAATAKRA